MLKFPDNFFWGAATSSHQVEGNNINNDWWEWEKRVGLKEPSGQACRHYELYRQDFELVKNLNHNAHRFSLEWSRIQPNRGEFSKNEIAHYQDVVVSLRELGIEPLVTLHHFTNPLWFSRMGGWEDKNSPDYFAHYVENVVQALADKVRYWITINEPMVYAYYSYILGFWPPQKKSFFSARKVTNNLIAAHIKAYKIIHGIYKQKNLKPPLVSIAKNMQFFISTKNNLRNKLGVYLRHKLFNLEFIERLIKSKSLDFIGINYYTRSLVAVEKWSWEDLLLKTAKEDYPSLKKNSLGWDIYPQGLEGLLLGLKKYKMPVFILENGICTEDDTLRWEFIREHLKVLHRVIEKGIKVLGYIYWSLMDNYEWDKGFGQRFGLIDIDYSNLKRSLRESAKKFALVCKTNSLE